jgi:hypothetical protein
MTFCQGDKFLAISGGEDENVYTFLFEDGFLVCCFWRFGCRLYEGSDRMWFAWERSASDFSRYR